ncbi:MAG: hypothetical protein WBE13_09200 [Candidatus Acidiferrum sp.]
MLFGELEVTSEKFSEEFVSAVLNEVGANKKPPCAGGSRKKWTQAVKLVLERLGNKYGYEQDYPWLVDFIWWSDNPQRLGLAAESEFDTSVDAIEEDFQKLSVFKCPLKLLIFSADLEETKRMAQRWLQNVTQHVKDEEYLLIGFTSSGPRCFSFVVPTDGHLKEEAHFYEIHVSKIASAGG